MQVMKHTLTGFYSIFDMKFHYPHDPDDEFDWDDYNDARDQYDEACEDRAEFERENIED